MVKGLAWNWCRQADVFFFPYIFLPTTLLACMQAGTLAYSFPSLVSVPHANDPGYYTIQSKSNLIRKLSRTSISIHLKETLN